MKYKSILLLTFIISFLGMLIYTISNPNWYSELNLNYEGGFSGRWLIIFFAALAVIAFAVILSIGIVHVMCGV